MDRSRPRGAESEEGSFCIMFRFAPLYFQGEVLLSLYCSCHAGHGGS
jgi:hypothetical protein